MSSMNTVQTQSPAKPTALVVPVRSGKERLTPAKVGIKTLLSEGMIFTGDIEANHGMKIDCLVRGNITISCDNDSWLVVWGSAIVEGNIKARVVVVCGQVDGDVQASHITLTPGAIINGDITYSSIRIAEGAQVNGRMTRAETVVALPGRAAA